MKRKVKYILKFLKESADFIYCLYLLIENKSLSNPIKKTYEGTIALLANGPSLKEVLPRLTIDEEFKNIDFVVLNFFAFDNSFFIIKPKHYCFADPMFFHESHNSAKVGKLFNILNLVNWEMKIYIPSYRFKQFVKYSKLNNSYLNIVKVNVVEYKGYEKLRNFFYKKGLAIPGINTVAILAIFVSINNGFSKIKLYGVDHTFFDGLTVNDKNQLCNIETHFYDKEKQTPKPLMRNDNGKVWEISDYLEFVMLIFKSHKYLESYSKYMNCEIQNCTKRSLITCYNRVG